MSRFARRFKARTGLPPHQYLLKLRVEQARLLLRTSSDAIADIAAGCGFSHQEHLTRVLRTQLGTTPRLDRTTRQGIAHVSTWRSDSPGRNTRNGLIVSSSTMNRSGPR